MDEKSKRNLTQRSQFFYDKMLKDHHGNIDSVLYRIQAARYREEVNGILDFVGGRNSFHYQLPPVVEAEMPIKKETQRGLRHDRPNQGKPSLKTVARVR